MKQNYKHIAYLFPKCSPPIVKMYIQLIQKKINELKCVLLDLFLQKKSCHYMPSLDRNNIQMGTPLTRNITLMRTLQLIVTLIWSPTNAKPVAPKSQKKICKKNADNALTGFPLRLSEVKTVFENITRVFHYR